MSMPVALKAMVLAAVIGLAATPVWAAGIPEFGTKNFSPGEATPAYFSNENGTGDAEAADDGADDTTTRPVDRVAAPRYAVDAARQRRGQRWGKNAHSPSHVRTVGYGRAAAGRFAGGTRANQAGFASTQSRRAAAGAGAAGKSHFRHASVRQVPHRG
jgi:hypothetical protein